MQFCWPADGLKVDSSRAIYGDGLGCYAFSRGCKKFTAWRPEEVHDISPQKELMSAEKELMSAENV
jgi:hypothetical protein